MTLCKNGFPLNIAQTVIIHKITEFNKIKHGPVQKRLVYWLVELVRDFLSQSDKLYSTVISQQVYEWSLTLNPF